MDLFKTKQGEQLESLEQKIEHIKPHLLKLKALAMENTVKARIPECGDFGHIAQDLDYICNLLFGD